MLPNFTHIIEQLKKRSTKTIYPTKSGRFVLQRNKINSKKATSWCLYD